MSRETATVNGWDLETISNGWSYNPAMTITQGNAFGDKVACVILNETDMLVSLVIMTNHPDGSEMGYDPGIEVPDGDENYYFAVKGWTRLELVGAVACLLARHVDRSWVLLDGALEAFECLWAMIKPQ